MAKADPAATEGALDANTVMLTKLRFLDKEGTELSFEEWMEKCSDDDCQRADYGYNL